MFIRLKEYPKLDGLPIAITTKNITPHYEGLHVFVSNKLNWNESIGQFKELFSVRTNASKEYWLLDVPSNKEIEEIVDEDLNDLPLDLDDDLYLFQTFGKSIQIFEFYQIHKTLPKKIKPYGTWNDLTAMQIPTKQKWQRRKDLEVILIQMQYLKWNIPLEINLI